jgi:hypothetical protein
MDVILFYLYVSEIKYFSICMLKVNKTYTLTHVLYAGFICIQIHVASKL